MYYIHVNKTWQCITAQKYTQNIAACSSRIIKISVIFWWWDENLWDKPLLLTDVQHSMKGIEVKMRVAVPHHNAPSLCVLYNYFTIFTFSLLYLPVSHKSLIISVLMYQPLKPQAGYTIPPQSSDMLLTAGTAYHSKPRPSNLGYLHTTQINYSNTRSAGEYTWDDHSQLIPFER